MYAKVIIDIAHSNVDRLYTYAIPDGLPLAAGHRVLVPFGSGNRQTEGFVMELSDTIDEGVSAKNVIRTMEPYPALTREQIMLAYWMKEVYNCRLVDALRLMIPAELRGGRVREKTVRLVTLSPGVEPEEALASLLMKNGASRSPRQTEIIELLSSVKAPVSVPDICGFIPGASPAIAALIKKGIVADSDHASFRSPFARREATPSSPLPLTAAQSEALGRICARFDSLGGTCLLHGVTGSGKTEVYMQAASRAIAEGGRAIVLVPEISLTPQAMERFRGRFGERVAVLHSRLSPGERYDEWRRIRLGRVDVVIGARSAVFAPLENIKLIVVDEEHEPSYRSETNPRYGAAEIASFRAKRSGAVLVLGSATPSIASYRKALAGKYELLELRERINASPMPSVETVDMRREFASGNNSIFSSPLYASLKSCLDAGEQAILFMNRRGYSTFVSCRGCGYVIKCPDCDVSMTYHKLENVLKCHYCGRRMALPAKCPSCGKPYLKYFGVGTQQVEEQLHESFPGVKAIRMDLDTTRGKNAHYELLSRFQEGEAQVLIGTQMIAKGLDIPSVTMVGVIAADSMLHIPDYRSAERTFQLLTQVAGRAGRASMPGHVVIQSYTPEHPAIVFAANHDYRGFYDYEIASRRAALFPPFALFVRIVFSGRDDGATLALSDEFSEGLRSAVLSALKETGGDERELMFLFSAPAPIRKKQGLYRSETLMKLLRTKHTASAIRAVYAYYDARRPEGSGGVEINPGDMF